MKIRRKITFFHTDSIERLTMAEIEREARARGFGTRFSEDLKERAQIGVYCSHAPNPKPSRFSVVMLHDMAQRHDVWPHFWKQEHWSRFDLGLIPGRTWADRYLEHKRANRQFGPKLGLYQVGWPKSDPIFDRQGDFQCELEELRKTLNLSFPKTVLYAPSWENDGKQAEFVEAVSRLDCNLVVKQADWPRNTWGHIARNIDEMEEMFRDHPRVNTIDRKVSIMYALALADIVVSEESSVMVEALFFGTPAVAVTDWMIPDTETGPPRPPSIPFDFVRKTPKEKLRETIEGVLKDGHDVEYRGEIISLEDYSDLWFSRRGGSAKLIMDIIEDTLAGRRPACENVLEQPGYDGEGEEAPPESWLRRLLNRRRRG